MSSEAAFFDDSEAIDVNSKTRVQAPKADVPAEEGTGEHTRELLSLPDKIGHYQIIRKLGEGGMGVVYLAQDEVRNRAVALKVLSKHVAVNESSVKRFLKESRLLAEVRHECIAQLEEAGSSDGVCYLAIEFVDGTDLRTALSHIRIFPEVLALKLIRDVALGAAELHRRGIIHRDIKPGNILLSTISNSTSSDAEQPASEAVVDLLLSGGTPVVKLTDFGLARYVDQTESMQLTQAGAILGTPAYLAPEQCSATNNIGSATDVYSIGITLFELLTGRVPFKAPELTTLLSAHCYEAPPKVQKLIPGISDAVAALVSKMLSKRPEDRYIDAGHLANEIDRILKEDVSENRLHPLVPATNCVIQETCWEWELESSAEDLWPLVSDTDRVNSGAGLPAVTFSTERSSQGKLERFGSFRLGWTKFIWKENPYEWIEGRRFGVLREFQQGPFEWFLSTVELLPLPNGKTKLLHSVKVAPKGIFGRAVAYLEIKVKGSRLLDRVYRRIDQQLIDQNTTGKSEDPFTPPLPLDKNSKQRLENCVEALRKLEADPASVAGLANFIEESPAVELARIRPIVVARNLNLPQQKFIETCLHGTKVGLLELHWDIICPTCRVSTKIVDTIREIQDHVYCEACDLDFKLNFGRSVELIFRTDPNIRAADLQTYCIGGPEHAPHVISQLSISPGEALETELRLSAGIYNLRGPQLPYVLQLNVDAERGISSLTIPLAPGYEVSRLPPLRAGHQSIRLVNEFEQSHLIKIERTTPRKNVLTAADSSRIPLFQELFPNEILAEDQLTEVMSGTFLSIFIRNTKNVYAESGEVAAHKKLQEQMKRLRFIGQSFQGTLVREHDEQVVVMFDNIQRALSTLRFFLGKTEESTFLDSPFQLNFALHRGTVRATVVDGVEEYFGQVISTALELNPSHPELHCLVTNAVAADAEVKTAFEELQMQLTRINEDIWNAESVR